MRSSRCSASSRTTSRTCDFLSVGVIDAATMKGVEEVDRVRERTQASLQQYVDLARRLGVRRRLPDVGRHRGRGGGRSAWRWR